ncbi:MAG: ester cyclase [Mycobacteriales bacterium]
MTTPQVTSQTRSMLTRFLEVWNDHDVDKVLSFLTEDVVWTEPGLPMPVRGKEAAATSVRDTFTAFPDISWPKEDMRVYTSDNPAFAASSYTMVGTMHGRMAPGFAPTGKRFRLTGACLYELRDGLIARHTILYDSVTAMQQIGLLPDPDSFAFKAQMHLQSLTSRAKGLIRR